MSEVFRSIYYRFNQWRYGKSYGCSRCHHAVWLHDSANNNSCVECFCPEYQIERVNQRSSHESEYKRDSNIAYYYPKGDPTNKEIRKLADDSHEKLDGLNGYGQELTLVRLLLDRLENQQAALDAVPKWTKITDVSGLPENWWDYAWIWKSTSGEWVGSGSHRMAEYYLENKKVESVYCRPLCSIDYPKGDES